MNLYRELLCYEIGNEMISALERQHFDFAATMQQKAVSILQQIKDVLCDESLSDFDAIDAIVSIFTENHLDIGGRRDF